ncbi:MAG: exonuclease domain-containing protein [Clostridioides difficile]
METSGLNPVNSEILEIGAVKIDKDNNISTFETLIKINMRFHLKFLHFVKI